MEIEMREILRFDCVVFDPVNRIFEILDGTKGTYAFEEIERFAILNENARYRGKQQPFTALLPAAGLPAGYPYMYVGIKVVLKDNTILGIYVSKEKTMLNTDQYVQDRRIAVQIGQIFQEILSTP